MRPMSGKGLNLTLVQFAANFRFPEGFSMRAEVQYFLPAWRAARVDKPRKVEAAMAGIILWGKSAG